MGEYQLTQIDYIFEAVAHPARRAILARLTKSDARVTELASSFTISLNSTSKHIKILERAGLVRRTVNGRDHVLSLNARPLAEAAEWIEYYRQFWEDNLQSLEAFVTQKRDETSDTEEGKSE